MSIRKGVSLAFLVVAISTWSSVQGFNVGVKGTKCNLDPSKGEVNDPCGSLYDGVCAGSHCACPPATHEDSGLKRCVPGEAPKQTSSGTQSQGGSRGGGGFDPFDDLPFDYQPPGSKKTTPKPSAPAFPPPQQPPPQPQPGYPGQPQPGWQPPPQPGQPQPGYPGQPQPGYPGQPQPGYPGQPQPGYPGQPQPGYPGQPQPGYPGQPGKTKAGDKPAYKGDDRVGEKAGGGVGGVVGLLIIGGLIYFCCCKGGKGKEVMNRFGGGRFQGLPFVGGQHASGMQMQQSAPVQQDGNFGSQHTYVPPGGGDPAMAGQQPYPPAGGYYPGEPYAQQPGYAPYPPQGFTTDGQQPPPYTQQYQPNAPPQ